MGRIGRFCDLLCEKFYLTHLACSYEKYLIVNVQLMSWIFRLSRKKNHFRVQKPHFRQCVAQRYRRNWCVKKRRSGTFDLQPKPLSISRFLFSQNCYNWPNEQPHTFIFLYILHNQKILKHKPVGANRAFYAGSPKVVKMRSFPCVSHGKCVNWPAVLRLLLQTEKWWYRPIFYMDIEKRPIFSKTAFKIL